MNVQDVISQAALRYGQDPNTMLRMAQIESDFDPSARNPSGASGLFQFMPGTAHQYGLQDPFDPAASADAAARLSRDNASKLAAQLGRPPTAGELYLAHQQGAEGASGLLSRPDAPAASVVGLKAVTQNGGTPDMTAGQFANLWTSKFGPSSSDPNGSYMAYANPSDPKNGALDAIKGALANPGASPSAPAPSQGSPSMPNSIQSFIFGGNTGIKSPKELAQQRAMLAALAGPRAAPQNVGEGLSALGDAIDYRVLSGRADDAESAGEKSAQDAYNSLTAGGAAPNQQAIMAALSNPWLNDNQAAVVGDLAKRNFDASDPTTLLDNQYKQAQIDALRAKPPIAPVTVAPGGTLVDPSTGKTIYAAPVAPDKPMAVAPGGTLVDPNTGKTVFSAPAAPAKPMSVAPGGTVIDPATGKTVFSAPPAVPNNADVAEYEYAVKNGFKGSILDYANAKKGNGLQVTTNPDGTTTITQGGPSKALTEGQGKDVYFYNNGAGALPTIDKLGDALTNPVRAAAGSLPVVGNFAKGGDYQQAEQAGNTFLNAILRKESGAAVPEEEQRSYGDVYLPRPGDGPAVLAQKKAARARALQGIKMGLPPAAILSLEGAGVDTNIGGNADKGAPPAAAPPSDGVVDFSNYFRGN